jgi:peptide/nickel transport system substrate-binding protein
MKPFRHQGTLAVVVGGLVVALGLAACSSTTSQRTRAGSSTVTFAEAVGATPNYIFPMQNGAELTDANRGQFSSQMFLPLYWLGDQGRPTVDPNLSLAALPTFSDNNSVVTIVLKHWIWSDGAPVTARDVMFWLNLLSAVTDPQAPLVGSSSAPGPGWGDAVPGEFPENVVSYEQTGTYTVVLRLNASYNPTWFLDNELTQIYPLPAQSWDRLSSGGPIGTYDETAQARVLLPTGAGQSCTDCYVPADPGTASTGALGVAQFLNSQSEDTATYTTNPLWQVVDGPFHLSQYVNTGFVKMLPNKSYSGPQKPKIGAFEELPFTSDTSEFDAVRSGTVTIGYVPPQDLNQIPLLEKREGYSYAPWYVFGLNLIAYNFTNPTVGPILQQQYFRQALQLLINQPQYISSFQSGVGKVENGVVPTYPPNDPFVSPLERGSPVYPYDPARAVALLSAHGWSVHPGGTTVCGRAGTGPSDCGQGVASGQPATFNLLYASGSTALTGEMQAYQSTLSSKAGISLHLSATPVAQAIGVAFNNCTPATPCGGWQIVDWYPTDGWTWLGGLPTGGVMFSNGGANAGDFTSAELTADINLTHTAATQAAEEQAMYRYEDYVLRQAIFGMLPNLPFQLTVYKKNLRGLVPQGVFTEIYPQNYELGG